MYDFFVFFCFIEAYIEKVSAVIEMLHKSGYHSKMQIQVAKCKSKLVDYVWLKKYAPFERRIKI